MNISLKTMIMGSSCILSTAAMEQNQINLLHLLRNTRIITHSEKIALNNHANIGNLAYSELFANSVQNWKNKNPDSKITKVIANQLMEITDPADLELEMEEYKSKKEKNIKTSDLIYRDSSALHLAAHFMDISVINRWLPKLFHFKMIDVINKTNKDATSPFGYLIRNLKNSDKYPTYSDKNISKIVSVFLKFGAQIHPAQLYYVLRHDGFETATLILKNFNCEEVLKIYSNTNTKPFKDFIRENHKCDTCKFE